MAHRRNKPRRVSPGASPRQAPKPETQPRSIDTGQQMRDTLRVARTDEVRRFAERTIRDRLAALRRLETEDLRRNRHERKNLGRETYRCENGSRAPIGWHSVRKPEMRQPRLPDQMRYVFRDAQGTIVCQRRKVRRAVIFALQRAGKGGKKNRKARWTERSEIVCRRVR